MSQWMRDTSTPNSAIALAPMEPTIPSSSGATASRARPMRSSLRTSGDRENTSSTAQARAQLHMDKWGGRRQPVGHQGLDHLTVGRIGDVAHRAGTIGDPGDVETSAERRYDRECPQRLFHTGWPVADLTSCHGDLVGDDPRCHLEAYTLQDDKTRIPEGGDDGRARRT